MNRSIALCFLLAFLAAPVMAGEESDGLADQKQKWEEMGYAHWFVGKKPVAQALQDIQAGNYRLMKECGLGCDITGIEWYAGFYCYADIPLEGVGSMTDADPDWALDELARRFAFYYNQVMAAWLNEHGKISCKDPLETTRFFEILNGKLEDAVEERLIREGQVYLVYQDNPDLAFSIRIIADQPLTPKLMGRLCVYSDDPVINRYQIKVHSPLSEYGSPIQERSCVAGKLVDGSN